MSEPHKCPNTGMIMMGGDAAVSEWRGQEIHAILIPEWSDGTVAPNDGSRKPVSWIEVDGVWTVNKDMKP